MQWLDEDFAESCDFDVIGIGSAVGPHRLGWELNGRFGWALEYHHIIQSPQRQGHSDHLVYRGGPAMLVLNRHAEGSLVKTSGVARLDYLLRLEHMDDPNEQLDFEAVVKGVRSLSSVTLATPVDPHVEGIMEHLAVLDCASPEEDLH
ncbi:MAG: hypothetical protein ACPGYK_05065 [Flavobacteriales bacterium]